MMKRILLLMSILLMVCNCAQDKGMVNVSKIDRDRILKDAKQYLNEQPVTVTDTICERSLGGKHDFYSEGDYWWPDPENPDGPYIRRDGMTNPNNFIAHRKAMRRMSIQVATLVAAYKVTKEEKYADKAIAHLKAWFVNPNTRMNPNMNYAQAIKGRCAGRGVGLIDGIHFVEPVRAITYLEETQAINDSDLQEIKNWFADFLQWMTTHEYGIDERERENNHGTCWVMQVAEFSRFTDNKELMEYCRNRYKTVLLPNQLSADGSYHMELARTKPYGYSLFNLDIMATVCQILSTPDDNLWQYKMDNGVGMEEAMAFMVPYIADKSQWPYDPDVMYWEQWPVRHPALLFAGLAYDKDNYIELWKTLKHMPETEEGLRNFPIRQPVLWVNNES